MLCEIILITSICLYTWVYWGIFVHMLSVFTPPADVFLCFIQFYFMHSSPPSTLLL